VTLPGADRDVRKAVLPRPLRVAAAWAAALLLIAVALYVTALALTRIWLIVVSVVAALLLTALFHPLHRGLRRVGAPEAVAALATLMSLLGLLAFTVLVIWRRVSSQLDVLRVNVTAGLDEVRDWLVNGPPSLSSNQVDRLVSELAGLVSSGSGVAADLIGGARMAIEVVSGVVLALFLLFFLLKDGARMWGWIVGLFPSARRARVDGAGRRGWETLGGYVRGTTIVALVDAVLIGLALVIIGVPLPLTLALLTFFGAFIPLVGATIAGAAAVLVALVARGLVAAVLVLVAVLLVQQIEGNVLQPWIMRRAVSIHPVPLVLAVAIGSLVAGVGGAVMAVPLLAVGYHVAAYLWRVDDGAPPDPARGTAAEGVVPVVEAGEVGGTSETSATSPGRTLQEHDEAPQIP
jgi:predicted PurR-regulated permease PerM